VRPPRPDPARPSRVPLVAVVLALAGALTACSSSAPRAQTPPVQPAPSITTNTAPSAGASAPGAASSPSSTDAAPTSAAVSPSGSPSTAAPAYAPPALSWRSCEGGLQCATLTVPVDYAQPAGPTLGLALIRQRATGSRRIGSLVFNPGGPGASGYDYVRDGSTGFSTQLQNRFDTVGFDPRGVSRSRGVDCTTDAQLEQFLHDDPTPDSPAARAAFTADSKAFASRCAKAAGALLAHVSTVEAARDLEALRLALGEATLSYFGYSYGTYLGATYAELYPTHVRAAVLDGALDPRLDLVAFVQGQAKGFEEELDRWFAWCTTGSGCAFAGSAGRSPQQRFDAVAAAVRSHPLRVGSRTVGPGEFSYGVGYTLYSRASWPELGSALAAAAGGDGSALLALSDSYTDRGSDGHYSDSTDANYAVNCLDHAGPRTEQGWYAAARAVRAAAPRLGEAIVYNTLPCAFWPVPPRAQIPIDAAGSPPLLVVGTTHDPATPYVWAQSLAHQLSAGVLLTHDGDGHTAYGAGSACTVAAVDRYLVDLVPPPAGTRC